MHKVLYVYKWATMGGVERVLLNRAQAFKSSNLQVAQDVFFLHDSGGKRLLNKYINDYKLGHYLQVVEKFVPDQYDVIHSIDTPEIFDMMKNNEKIFFECHTAYTENRTYIAKLPLDIKGIIVPSEKFRQDIMDEIPILLQENTFTLRNSVPKELFTMTTDVSKRFNKIPIAYIGRIDKLKNTEEVIEIFSLLQKRLGDRFILLVAGPITSEVNLFKIIENKNLSNRFIYLPPLPFEKIINLLNFIKVNNGLFISSSKGESFGLSVAEAIMSGIPVVASHLHSHLVNGNQLFLYQLGNLEEAVRKIECILENSKTVEDELLSISENFSNIVFLNDWSNLFEREYI
ncbi:glycosyltransferase family 4 protein [Lysinibacillus telephonicus]|uniref:Glycosyltransferase n=1 Tax=Lysinibacillus telephonicus TaxID=1714840 RepID=A0A431US14_9BACI|nr:glycosyltransferase family 4 protein [Lysinibacillus telephonicus]RTQ93154.1 glycosyltransferase [Lysinibacillus telephonicus]